MREIKFIGKRVDNGEWAYGYLIGKDVIVGDIIDFDNEYFTTEFWYKVIPETVGQFTGLKDKNGFEIYEGDIVEAWSQGRKASGEIKQRIDGTWIMYPSWQKSEMWYLIPNDNGETTVEVIGNIHEKEQTQ